MVFLTPSRMGRPLCSLTFQRGDIIVACITKIRGTDGPICRNRYRYFVFGPGYRPSALRIWNDFCNTCIYPAMNYRATKSAPLRLGIKGCQLVDGLTLNHCSNVNRVLKFKMPLNLRAVISRFEKPVPNGTTAL